MYDTILQVYLQAKANAILSKYGTKCSHVSVTCPIGYQPRRTSFGKDSFFSFVLPTCEEEEATRRSRREVSSSTCSLICLLNLVKGGRLSLFHFEFDAFRYPATEPCQFARDVRSPCISVSKQQICMFFCACLRKRTRLNIDLCKSLR